MYDFILWICLASQPQCPMDNTPSHWVMVFKAKDKAACEAMWEASKSAPDPQGMISRHACDPISESL